MKKIYENSINKAKKWIERNTVQGKGIVITSKQRSIYQEVTGYYIPTLLQWNMQDKAINYARYLCSIQEKSGAWLDGSQSRESVFNTGQVLRGLVAILDILPEVKEHLIRGCDWLVSRINDEGRLVSTNGTNWENNGFNSELIHLYCLPPLKETGEKLNIKSYVINTNKVKDYYILNYKEDIANFNYLSHFYAYILEALFDLGEKDIVKHAMRKINIIQRFDGSVPAFKDCTWVCSTGLFQLAIVWFKLGDLKRGKRALDYAISLQNNTGGWYGGYISKLCLGKKVFYLYVLKEKVNYFPNEEISWAVKYFFDALYFGKLAGAKL